MRVHVSAMCVCTCVRSIYRTRSIYMRTTGLYDACCVACILLLICELQVCMTHAVLHVSSSSYANYRSNIETPPGKGFLATLSATVCVCECVCVCLFVCIDPTLTPLGYLCVCVCVCVFVASCRAPTRKCSRHRRRQAAKPNSAARRPRATRRRWPR